MYKSTAFVLLIIGICHALPMRIVDGVDTDITEVPYQVSLQYSSKNYHICGGSILSDRWILTAGHCSASVDNPTDKQVVVGMTKQSEGGVVHTIKRIIRDSRYGSMHRFSHDIALMELNEPIQFNERAQRVLLPMSDEPLPVGGLCIVQGWGRLYQNGPPSDHLQSTALPIWEPKDCAAAYRYSEDLFVGPNAPLICAGWDGSRPDTCNGDSGGALVCNGVQYGIVSFGKGCANSSYPKVFSHVYNLRDFIAANVDFKV